MMIAGTDILSLEETVEIRKITESERLDFAELDRYSFSEWKLDPVKEDVLETIDPLETFGCFLNGKMVAGLRNSLFHQFVRGVPKTMGGIGCVCTYPEYRSRGFVKLLMQAAFQDMQNRGMSVSMLDPFREDFYDAFGYVKTGSRMSVDVPRTSMDHYLKKQPVPGWSTERMDCLQAREPFLEILNELGPEMYHGVVIPDNICDATWKEHYKNWLFVFIKNEGRIQAAARFRIKGFMETGKILLSDMIWWDIESRSALFGFIAGHRDQVTRIQLVLPFGINFYQWIFNAVPPVSMDAGACDWMVRVMDVIEAVKDLPGSSKGALTMAVIDQRWEPNNGIYRLQSRDEKLVAERVNESCSNECNIRGLSALIFGTLPVDEIIARDWMCIPEKADRELLRSWFPVKVFYSSFHF